MPGAFSDVTMARFEAVYRHEVRPLHGENARGGCMHAVYAGLEALFGERYGFRGAFFREFFRANRRLARDRGISEEGLNTIDRVFSALESEGVAEEWMAFERIDGGWALRESHASVSVEGELLARVGSLPDGFHVFGVSAAGGYHSLLLAVRQLSFDARVYWMDQYSDGIHRSRPGGFVASPDVTGRLDTELLQLPRGRTQVWRLVPNAADGISMPRDGSLSFP